MSHWWGALCWWVWCCLCWTWAFCKYVDKVLGASTEHRAAALWGRWCHLIIGRKMIHRHLSLLPPASFLLSCVTRRHCLQKMANYLWQVTGWWWCWLDCIAVHDYLFCLSFHPSYFLLELSGAAWCLVLSCELSHHTPPPDNREGLSSAREILGWNYSY